MHSFEFKKILKWVGVGIGSALAILIVLVLIYIFDIFGKVEYLPSNNSAAAVLADSQTPTTSDNPVPESTDSQEPAKEDPKTVVKLPVTTTPTPTETPDTIPKVAPEAKPVEKPTETTPPPATPPTPPPVLVVAPSVQPIPSAPTPIPEVSHPNLLPGGGGVAASSLPPADTTPPVISILGTNPLAVQVGSTYTDAGATASDNLDGNITANIVTVNPVNTATVGTYTVTYNVSDAHSNTATQKTRTVNVVDTTAPVITVTGTNPVTVQAGSTYADAGATAVDTVDGNRTVNTTGTVNTAVLGTYTLNYTASDLSGNTATATRTVNVVDTTAPVITVTGTSPLTVESGTTYTDAGATASDNLDGNITASIVTVNPVNTAVVGTYTVTYNVSDAHSNAATQKTRTVNVVDTTPPVISSLTLTPSSGSVGIGGTVTLTIAADGSNYTAGTITVNGVATTGFTHTTGNNYTATYTVASGNTNRSAGNVPASVILTDAAGNSNVAYTTVSSNTLRINGQVSNSATQIFPSFSSDSTFTSDLVFDCSDNSGDIVIYAIADSGTDTYNFLNQPTSGGNIYCHSPAGHYTAYNSGSKFGDNNNTSGYSNLINSNNNFAGWFYVSFFLTGNSNNCTHAIGVNCTPPSPNAFARLHRNSSGVWSDSDN